MREAFNKQGTSFPREFLECHFLDNRFFLNHIGNWVDLKFQNISDFMHSKSGKSCCCSFKTRLSIFSSLPKTYLTRMVLQILSSEEDRGDFTELFECLLRIIN